MTSVTTSPVYIEPPKVHNGRLSESDLESLEAHGSTVLVELFAGASSGYTGPIAVAGKTGRQIEREETRGKILSLGPDVPPSLTPDLIGWWCHFRLKHHKVDGRHFDVDCPDGSVRHVVGVPSECIYAAWPDSAAVEE